MNRYSLEERFGILRSNPLNSSAYKGKSSSTRPILYPTIPTPRASRNDFLPTEQPTEGSLHPSGSIEADLHSTSDTFVLVRACSNFTILTQAQQADAHTEDESDSSVPHTRSVEFKSKNQYETVGSVGHKVLSLLCNDAFDSRYMMDGDRGCIHVLESPQYPGLCSNRKNRNESW